MAAHRSVQLHSTADTSLCACIEIGIGATSKRHTTLCRSLGWSCLYREDQQGDEDSRFWCLLSVGFA